MKKLVLKLIRLYQHTLSPDHGYGRIFNRAAGCRFHPSCSQYALEALTVHGAGRGSWLAIRRVGRCHPWHDGGLDPVPPATRSANVRSTLATPVGVAEEG